MLVPPLRKLLPPALPRTLQSPSPAHFFILIPLCHVAPSCPISVGCGCWRREGREGRRAGCSGPIRRVQSWKATPALERSSAASLRGAGGTGAVRHRQLLTDYREPLGVGSLAAGTLSGDPHPWGGSWPAAGQQHLRRSLRVPGAGDSFADGVAANVPESSVKR